MDIKEKNDVEKDAVLETKHIIKNNKIKRRFFATGKWYKIAITLILWSVLQEILMASTDLIDNVFVNHIISSQVKGFDDLTNYIKGTGWAEHMTEDKLNSVGLGSLTGYALDNINYTPGQIGVNGVSASNQLYIIMFAMVSGFCYGSGIFSAQYFGAGEYQKLKHITCLKMYLTLIITMIFALIGIQQITKYFIGFTTHPDYEKAKVPLDTYLTENSSAQEIKQVFEYIQNKVSILSTEQGEKYYRIVSLSYPILTINQVATTALRETRRPFYSFFMSSISLIANALCNVFFTAPTFIPNYHGFGVVGAAIGTVSSRVLQLGFIVGLLAIKKFEFIPRIRHFIIPKYILRISLIKSLPILLNETLFAFGQVMQVKLRAQYSADSLSANAMYETMLMAFFSPMYHGLNAGISTLVGNELGAKHFDEAKYNAKHLMRFSFMIACVFLILFSGLSWVIPKLIFPNTTHEGIKIGEWMVFIYSATYPVILMNSCVYSILRAGGNVVQAFLMDSAFNWVFQIPVLFVLIYYNTFNNPQGFINLDIIYIHLIVCMFEILKLIPSMIFYFRGKWLTSIIDETKFEHKDKPKDKMDKSKNIIVEDKTEEMKLEN
ncbi:MATE family efflux transporter [Spiroplasma tabanidicola]|uniref:Probable multidrug resistance protein NorM n=1 Tax=Spiroplasma tabanidicola TaxID=324079 RepID=A0A6I6CBW9_9MOLU|nr:MATE family efflux transporter [Spiroplasma tabanidicola]QGS51592.1 MATE family efflux transporter [Spiroplasma tabanidicola]